MNIMTLVRCPLCLEPFPVTEVRRHLTAESEEIRNYTIELIKRDHPEWVSEDGACSPCWKYYEQL